MERTANISVVILYILKRTLAPARFECFEVAAFVTYPVMCVAPFGVTPFLAPVIIIPASDSL